MSGLERFSPLERYTAASERAAGQIIGAYSTSFGMATRLLRRRHRTHIRNIYAMVRVADELVDGVATGAGITKHEQGEALGLLEQEVERAMHSGYSSNPIVHAFASTARFCGITRELTRPFFSSMRMDLRAAQGDSAQAAQASSEMLRFGDLAHADYVYGSAEVVGLMCLRVFLRGEDRSPEEARALEHGARRLGAAFQNVNFLRDLGDDTSRLGRSYLSGHGEMDAESHRQWIATIRAQLRDAGGVLPLLPRDACIAVGCALRLFASLTDRLEKTPPEVLVSRRVRVGTPAKVWLMMRSVSGARKAWVA